LDRISQRLFAGKRKILQLRRKEADFSARMHYWRTITRSKIKKERKIILQYWNLLPSIDMNSLWIKASILSTEEKLTSKGMGLIDAVIIAACHAKYLPGHRKRFK